MNGRRRHASTVPGAALGAVLARRHEALSAQVGDARDGDVHGVHQARVASRRLREAVPVLATGLDVRVKPVKRRLRAVTRALGAVRELDVALGMVAALAAASPDDADLQQQWTRHLRAQRRAPAQALRKALARRERRALDTLLTDLVEARTCSDDAEWRAALARRIATRARDLADAIERTGALYHPEALHEVRIAGKKLRYVLELAAETGLTRVTRALATLKTAQASLGELHDLDVLLSTLRSVPRARHGKVLQGAAERAAAALEHESRLLHARYLRSRGALMRVTELATRTVVAAVRGTRSGPPPRQEHTRGR